MRVFAIPFDIAADRIGQRNAHRLAVQMLLKRSFKIVDYYLARIARIVDAPAGINEPAVFVE